MITTRLTLLGLPVLVLAASAGLATAPAAVAQPPLPTYTCKYTPITSYLVIFSSMRARRCAASPGAPLDGNYFYPVRMENSVTGEKWECGGAFPYLGKPIHPGMGSHEAEAVLNAGVDASNCRPI
ncbi:hypothetical protein [Nocardia arthritidis]|uniref:hypothetical protein n=1 Tax=Nocardia arthritidis TaxID=228602 RepID=UPI0007A41491|nr:hypothetical protein [Nocardia arthritidis]